MRRILVILELFPDMHATYHVYGALSTFRRVGRERIHKATTLPHPLRSVRTGVLAVERSAS